MKIYTIPLIDQRTSEDLLIGLAELEAHSEGDVRNVDVLRIEARTDDAIEAVEALLVQAGWKEREQ